MIEFPRLQAFGDTSFFFAVLCPKGINFRRQGKFSAHRAERSGAKLENVSISFGRNLLPMRLFSWPKMTI